MTEFDPDAVPGEDAMLDELYEQIIADLSPAVRNAMERYWAKRYAERFVPGSPEAYEEALRLMTGR